MSKNERTRARLRARDGDLCHYCSVLLAWPDQQGVLPTWRWDEWEPKAWCYCGECPESDPCGLHVVSRWVVATGYSWPEIEHKVPRARGGASTDDNLVLSCGPCNRRKRFQTADEFMAAS